MIDSTRFNRKFWINTLVIIVSIKMMIVSVVIYAFDRKAPPFHLAPDMDDQPRIRAQTGDMFVPPLNTVSLGSLKEDSAFYRGRNEDGSFVNKMPVKVDKDLLDKGQRLYQTNCTPCHDVLGTGRGTVVYYANPFLVPNFHKLDKTKAQLLKDDGYIFKVITDGTAVMGSYSDRLNEAERWAVVAYVRALMNVDLPTEVIDGTAHASAEKKEDK